MVVIAKQRDSFVSSMIDSEKPCGLKWYCFSPQFVLQVIARALLAYRLRFTSELLVPLPLIAHRLQAISARETMICYQRNNVLLSEIQCFAIRDNRLAELIADTDFQYL